MRELRWLLTRTVFAVVLVMLALFAVGGRDAVATRWGGDRPTSGPIARATFKDRVGRTCTQVSRGSSLAIDCAWPPAEDRLGTLLKGLTNP